MYLKGEIKPLRVSLLKNKFSNHTSNTIRVSKDNTFPFFRDVCGTICMTYDAMFKTRNKAENTRGIHKTSVRLREFSIKF